MERSASRRPHVAVVAMSALVVAIAVIVCTIATVAISYAVGLPTAIGIVAAAILLVVGLARWSRKR